VAVINVNPQQWLGLEPHGLEVRRLAIHGWPADYERLARATGAVAVLTGAMGDAAASHSLCDALHGQGCATLRIDAPRRASVAALTRGLVEALQCLRSDHRGVPLGVFGAGLAGCAALQAAAMLPGMVEAVVALELAWTRAMPPLGWVSAATLLMVGRDDPVMLDASRRALPRLGGARRLEIVPGAGDRGDATAAQAVADIAAQWFAQRLPLRPLH
jgi:pimeloyl-ACP methyl ester carboxylesterase